LFSVEKKSEIGFTNFYFQLKKKIPFFYRLNFPKMPKSVNLKTNFTDYLPSGARFFWKDAGT